MTLFFNARPSEELSSSLIVTFKIAELAKKIHPEDVGINLECPCTFEFPREYGDDRAELKNLFREHVCDCINYLNKLKASPLSKVVISAGEIDDLLSSVTALIQSLNQETRSKFSGGTFPVNWQIGSGTQAQ